MHVKRTSKRFRALKAALAQSETKGTKRDDMSRTYVYVKPELTRAYVCQSLNRVYPGRGFGRPPPARRTGAFCDAGGASPAGPTRSMSILVKHRAGKVSVKPRLARTHALPALSQTPLVRHPDLAYINLGLTEDPTRNGENLRLVNGLPPARPYHQNSNGVAGVVAAHPPQKHLCFWGGCGATSVFTREKGRHAAPSTVRRRRTPNKGRRALSHAGYARRPLAATWRQAPCRSCAQTSPNARSSCPWTGSDTCPRNTTRSPHRPRTGPR